MSTRKTAFLLIALLVGCANASSDTDSADDDFTGTASKNLDAALFTDAYTGGDAGLTYVLLGHLPSSKESCSVEIRRLGLRPPQNSWSSVTIHPMGRSAKSTEAHGPVDIPFATTKDQSDDKDKLVKKGDQLLYTRTTTNDDSPGHKGDQITLTLNMAGKSGWDAITSADIDGDTIVGHQAATCVDLKPGFDLKKVSDYQPITDKAANDWAKAHGENLADEGIELETCQVTTPKRFVCNYGNETNEETLDLTFALANGKIGKLLYAERHSDFQ